VRPNGLPLVGMLAGLAVLGFILATLVIGAGASASSLPGPPPPIKPPASSVPFRESPPQTGTSHTGIMRASHALPAASPNPPNPKMVPVRDVPDSRRVGLEENEAVIPAQGLEKIDVPGPDLDTSPAPLPPGPPLPISPQTQDKLPVLESNLDSSAADNANPKIEPRIENTLPPKSDSMLNLPVQPRDGFIIETEPVQPLAEPHKTDLHKTDLHKTDQPRTDAVNTETLKPDVDAPKLFQFPETNNPAAPKSIEVNLLPEPAKTAAPSRGPEVMLFPEMSKTPTPLKLQSPASRPVPDETPVFNPPHSAPVAQPTLTKPPLEVPATPTPKAVPLTSRPQVGAQPLVQQPSTPQPLTQRPLELQPALPAPSLRTAVPIRRAPRPEPARESVSRSPGPAEPRAASAEVAGPRSPGPMLTVEKRGPTSVAMGQPVRYEIIIQNLGSEVAPQVRVEDDLSDGLRYLDGSPQPVLQDGKVVWSIDQLAPGAKQNLYLDAQAAANGEVICHTSVSLYGGLTTTIAPPVLELEVRSPGRVATGKKAVFDIRMKNVAGLKLTGLTLQAIVPPGLRHPQGTTIEADIGDLAAGASRNIPLPLETTQPGRHFLEARVRSGDSQEALAQGTVLVGEAGLALQVGAAKQAALDRECDVLIELANSEPQAVRNIAITDTLPEGLDYVASSDRGMYRSVTRSVHWVLDYLPPGQSRTLRLRVRPRTAAVHVHQVIAQSQDGHKTQAEGTINVQGQARVTMNVSHRDDPLRIGRETVYEVRVLNEGTLADTGVEVRASFPDGLLPRAAQAPVPYRIDGQSVVFEPLAQLDGQKQAIYRITAQARSSGDQRMSVSATSRQLASPLVREDRTWVFRE